MTFSITNVWAARGRLGGVLPATLTSLIENGGGHALTGLIDTHAFKGEVLYNSSSACPVFSSPCIRTYLFIVSSLIPTVDIKYPSPHIPFPS